MTISKVGILDNKERDSMAFNGILCFSFHLIDLLVGKYIKVSTT